MSSQPTQRRTFVVAQKKTLTRLYLGHYGVGCCLVLILVLGSGCQSLKQWYHNGFKVGPNHCTPPATVSDVWMASEDDRVSLDSSDFSQWWSVFNDPVLDGLILNAYQQNLTLREAGFRVLQAQAERAIARGEKFPQVQQMNGDYTRLQTSDNILSLFSGVKSIDQWNFGFNVAWELDVWGRFRRLVEAVQRKGVRVTVISTIKSSPPMIADELRRQADSFVELTEIQEYISRPVSQRNTRQPMDGMDPDSDMAPIIEDDD